MQNNMFGYSPTTNTWRSNVEKYNNNAITLGGEFEIDPYLPALGVDSRRPGVKLAIGAGRFVGLGTSIAIGGQYSRTLTSEGKALLTSQNGRHLAPIGMSASPLWARQNSSLGIPRDGYNQTVMKNFVAEVPYVDVVTDAQGQVRTGDSVTGHPGGTDSLARTQHTGRPVKWLSRQVYNKTASAAATQVLTSAAYIGAEPRFVAAFTSAGALLPSVTCALAWSSGDDAWSASFTGTGSGTVATVLYDYGHSADMIGGRVTEIKSLVQMQNDDRFMKYVESGNYMDFPPVAQRRPVTTVSLTDSSDPGTGETPTEVSTNVYRVAHYPMSIFEPVNVWIKGTVIDLAGNSSTYSSDWYPLPKNSFKDVLSQLAGDYYHVNWLTGQIYIHGNITVTAIRVTYSYLTNPTDSSVLWGKGIFGLTDGNQLTPGDTYSATQVVPTNPQGIPAGLNYPGVLGALRVFVY